MSFWNNIVEGISDLAEFVVSGFKRLIALLFVLLIALCILYALYWIGKALLGFLKHYSQFA
jgi:hypothetical protein